MILGPRVMTICQNDGILSTYEVTYKSLNEIEEEEEQKKDQEKANSAKSGNKEAGE